MWSKEENKQLKKNWKKATEVTNNFLAVQLPQSTYCAVC